MSRHLARETAMAVVFEKIFGESSPTINEYLQKNMKLNEEDNRYVAETTDGVFAHIEEIDRLIGENSIGWKPERLPKVDLAIMRLAIYEILFEPETAAEVAIDEAVELAKKYSTAQSAQFINGVLDAVYKKTEDK